MFGLYWEFINDDEGFELKDGDWLTWSWRFMLKTKILRSRKVDEFFQLIGDILDEWRQGSLRIQSPRDLA